jgi:hypothetical protein
MSQFNLYLERAQNDRIYYTKEIEYYDEGLKDVWNKIKEKWGSLKEAFENFKNKIKNNKKNLVTNILYFVLALMLVYSGNLAYKDISMDYFLEKLNSNHSVNFNVSNEDYFMHASQKEVNNIFGINYFLIKNPKVSMILINEIEDYVSKLTNKSIIVFTRIPYVTKNRKEAEEKIKEYDIENILKNLSVEKEANLELFYEITSGTKNPTEEDLGNNFLTNLKKLEKINEELIELEGQADPSTYRKSSPDKTRGIYYQLPPENDDTF